MYTGNGARATAYPETPNEPGRRTLEVFAYELRITWLHRVGPKEETHTARGVSTLTCTQTMRTHNRRVL